jgi:radical SAM superfamily enzyme YgiQ (UPF0313 family)
VDEEAGENLGMGYVGAALAQAGIDVELLDAGLEGWNTARSVREIRGRTWKVLGLSVVLPTMVPPALSILENLGSPGLVMMGGHTPSLAAERLLAGSPRDDLVVVVGEGEVTSVELVRAYLSGASLDGIPGIARSGPNRSEPRPLIQDLDALPFPDRRYLRPALARGQDAMVASSRGCYNNCVFCSVGAFYGLSPGPKWRARSPGNIADEVERLVKDHSVRQFRFADDNFMGPGEKGRQRAEAIAGEFLKRRLPVRFEVSVRANDVEEDLFRQLKEAGLYRVFLGVEAGVDACLERLGKNLTVEENRRAVFTLRRLGLEPYIGFILFDPDTTLNELVQNLAFLQEIRGKDGIVNSRLDLLNRLEVYEGTPVSGLLRSQGRLTGNYLDYRYPFKDRGVALIYSALRLAQRLLIPVRRSLNRARRLLKARSPASLEG